MRADTHRLQRAVDSLPKLREEEEMLTAYTTCPICGREFYVSSVDAWTYKKYPKKVGKTILFCTWTCMRKWERSHEHEGQN